MKKINKNKEDENRLARIFWIGVGILIHLINLVLIILFINIDKFDDGGLGAIGLGLGLGFMLFGGVIAFFLYWLITGIPFLLGGGFRYTLKKGHTITWIIVGFFLFIFTLMFLVDFYISYEISKLEVLGLFLGLGLLQLYGLITLIYILKKEINLIKEGKE